MATPVPASGEFRLDVEAAEEAVRTLEEVRTKIEAARARALLLAKMPPTARDPVSLEAFALLAEKADGGPGSFTAAMEAGREHVDRLIAQMRADIARQREADVSVAAALGGRA